MIETDSPALVILLLPLITAVLLFPLGLLIVGREGFAGVVLVWGYISLLMLLPAHHGLLTAAFLLLMAAGVLLEIERRRGGY